jgi:hypothetical protein
MMIQSKNLTNPRPAPSNIARISRSNIAPLNPSVPWLNRGSRPMSQRFYWGYFLWGHNGMFHMVSVRVAQPIIGDSGDCHFWSWFLFMYPFGSLLSGVLGATISLQLDLLLVFYATSCYLWWSKLTHSGMGWNMLPSRKTSRD